MRVTFLLNMLSPDRIPFFVGLASQGLDVRLGVSNILEPNRAYEEPSRKAIAQAGIGLREIPGWTLDLRHFPVRTDYFQIPVSLGRMLDENEPQVVVSNQLGLRTLIAVGWGRSRRIPVIPWVNVSAHTEIRNSGIRERFRSHLISRASRVFTNATEGARYLRETLGVDPKKIVEIPYAVSERYWGQAVRSAGVSAEDLRRRLGLKRNVLLYLGMMVRFKGIVELIRSFELLPRSEAQDTCLLAVGGEPPERLRLLAERSPVKVVWHPFVQPRRVPAFLALADALVFPSLWDEWGLVLNEGAAAGLPLLASKYAGATVDLVREGENGFVFDPIDPVSVANAVSSFLQLDAREREAMSVASRGIAREFDLDVAIQRTIRALVDVREAERTESS